MNIYEEDIDVLLDEEQDIENTLIVYNDDVNSFQWVIICLMEICGHTIESAEQLSLIIHYKGKAKVKNGSYEKLVPMKNTLNERGLSSEIN